MSKTAYGDFPEFFPFKEWIDKEEWACPLCGYDKFGDGDADLPHSFRLLSEHFRDHVLEEEFRKMVARHSVSQMSMAQDSDGNFY